MMRRFVNVVVQKWPKNSSVVYSLHRLDVADHLFYPSTADAEAAAAAARKAKAAEPANENGRRGTLPPPGIARLRRLPEPAMNFRPAPGTVLDHGAARLFALVSPRDGDGRVLFCNKSGQAFLYDADANCAAGMPVLHGHLGGRPVTFSVDRPGCPEQDLYVMHSFARAAAPSCFGVLRLGSRHYSAELGEETPGLGSGKWCWDLLPPPPLPENTLICSHAVVDGGRTILFSAKPDGFRLGPATTYRFDTVKREWARGGDWMLPFTGGAEHVPDLDLWLGFAAGGHDLCAVLEN